MRMLLAGVGVLLVACGGPSLDQPDGPYAPAMVRGLDTPVVFSVEQPKGSSAAGFAVDARTGALTPQPGGVVVVDMANSESGSCVRSSDGDVWCWTMQQYPEQVELAGPAVELTADRNNGCALLDDGQVQCWTWADRAVSTIATGVTALAAVDETTCMRTETGDVNCTTADSGLQPVTLDEPVTLLTAAGGRFCSAGTSIHCWTQAGTTERMKAPAAGVVRAIHVDSWRVCATMPDGVYCRGHRPSDRFTLRDDLLPGAQLHGGDLDCQRQTVAISYTSVSVEYTCAGTRPAWLGTDLAERWLYIDSTAGSTCAIDVDQNVSCDTGGKPATLAFRSSNGLVLRATGADGTSITYEAQR